MTNRFGNTEAFQITIPPGVSAYATGDFIGSAGVVTYNYTGSGVITGLVLTEREAAPVDADLDIYIYHDAPNAQTDNVAFAEAAGDKNKCVALFQVRAANYQAVDGTARRVFIEPVGTSLCHFNTRNRGDKLHFVAVSRGTPTYANDLELLLNVMLDT